MSDEKKQLKTLLGTRKTINNSIEDVNNELKSQIGSLMVAYGVGSSYDNPIHITNENKDVIIFVEGCTFEFIKSLDEIFNPIRMEILGGVQTTPFGEVVSPTLVIILRLFEEEE